MEQLNTHEQSFDKNVLLAVVMISSFLNPLMGAAVNVALPKIGTEFSLNAVGLSWVTMSYLLTSVIFLVPFGKISDTWGRKKIFLYGNIFFTIATFICAFAINDYMLIIGRLLQGIGGSMVFSTGMAIAMLAFTPQERGKIIGLNVAAVYLGLSLAPILGGILTESLGWRSLFYINAIIGIFISLAIFLKIKTEWAEKDTNKFDVTGSLIFMISITCLMYGFSKLPNIDAVILLIVGIIGIIFFVMFELKNENPVLNMKLFVENRVFAFSNLSALINYAATFAVSFLLSLYLQYAKGYSPSEAGLVLITQPLIMTIVAIIAGRLSDKKDPRILASIGMTITIIGLILLSFLEKDTNLNFIIISLVVLGIGFGLFSSPNTNSVMSSVDRKFYGIASATIGTMRTMGMMFSMAIASLSIHIFIGDAKLSSANVLEFIKSSHIVFLIFSALCFVGIFASLVGRKKENI